MSKNRKISFTKDVIGGFGSMFDISNMKIKDPVIVSCTDGVGTKIELANRFKKFDTIGIDLVAMCVNDLIVQGAKPLFFLDYIAVGKLNLHKAKKIIQGIFKVVLYQIVSFSEEKLLRCLEFTQKINLILLALV